MTRLYFLEKEHLLHSMVYKALSTIDGFVAFNKKYKKLFEECFGCSMLAD